VLFRSVTAQTTEPTMTTKTTKKTTKSPAKKSAKKDQLLKVKSSVKAGLTNTCYGGGTQGVKRCAG